jgi:predicted PurR-regulated permease PerM
VVGFFFLITFVAGGILSYIAGYFINKLNRTKVNKILMIIVGSLTGVSALSMVLNIILGYINFGA